MRTFESLLQVIETLLGPNGCPWDREQTFTSLQPCLLEEIHEVVEAIDLDDAEKMTEELGDMFFLIVFYAKIGEKTDRFTLNDVLMTIEQKLIRRHPHVFSDAHVKDAADVLKNWEKIKAAEKGKKQPTTPSEGIPPTLPLLTRAQKIVGRMLRQNAEAFGAPSEEPWSEERIGQELLKLIVQAQRHGLDAEGALRRALSTL